MVPLAPGVPSQGLLLQDFGPGTHSTFRDAPSGLPSHAVPSGAPAAAPGGAPAQ